MGKAFDHYLQLVEEMSKRPPDDPRWQSWDKAGKILWNTYHQIPTREQQEGWARQFLGAYYLRCFEQWNE